MLFYKERQINQISKYNDVVKSRLKDDGLAVILKGLSPEPYMGKFEHEKISCSCTGRKTEKRWCRCLVNSQQKSLTETCKNCDLKNIYAKPVENAVFRDFEVKVAKNKGGGAIDLIMDYCGKTYAVETKRPDSDETVLRMVAEIITYVYCSGKEMNKAIMFVKGSKQYSQWVGIRNGKDYKNKACAELREIVKKNDITVFCLEDLGDRYRVEILD